VLLVSLPATAVATGLAIAVLLPDPPPELWVGGGVLATLTALVFVMSDLLRGLGEVRWSNGTSGRSGGVVVLGVFVLLLVFVAPDTAGGALACLVVATATALVSLTAALVRERAWFTGAIRRLRPSDARASDVRATVSASAAFAGIQLVLLAGAQADLWVAGGVLDDAEVGAYAAAVRAMALVTLPLVTVQLASQAAVAHLAARGEWTRLEHQVRRLAAGASLPSAVLLSACVLAPALVLRVLLGPGYGGGAPVLAILALGQAVNVASGLCGTVLSMSGEERLVLGVTGVGAVASVLLGLGGAAVGGPVGLAMAAGLTTAATYGVLWGSCRRRLGIRTEPGWTRAPVDRPGELGRDGEVGLGAVRTG